jgi:RNA polymerase sigma factor (sigma-70 family)
MLDTTAGATDADLISAVRRGDLDAYGRLFDRHREAALRMARQLVRGPDADDLVAESFVRVMTILQDGKGPDEAFRAYLLTAIRRLHVDRIRSGSKVRSTDDDFVLDRTVEFVDPAEMRFEQSAAAAAFSSLPERWQLVLWHLDVEGQKPADVAPLLGMSANSVSALAYRAREGLRQAYLQGHLAPTLHDGCARTTGMLGAYVRHGLSARDTGRVEEHLDECSRCAGLHLELAEVNSHLSGVLGPAVLAAAFAGYAASGAGAGAGAGIASVAGAKLLAVEAVKVAIAPVKIAGTAIAGAGAQGVVAAAVVTSVATAGTVAVTTDFGGSGDRSVSAAGPAVAGRAGDPEPDRSAPTPVDTTPSPEPTLSPPTLLPTATPEPTVPTPPEPSQDQPTEPEPSDAEPSDAEPSPDADDDIADMRSTPSSPEPASPEPVPVLPTDYGIGAVAITDDDSVLQRRFTIPVTAANAGRAADQRVTLSMQFTRAVRFRGVVSAGWDCGGAVRNQVVRTLTCTTVLPAGQGTTFVAKAQGLRPAGTISIAADGDPRPDDNSVTFQADPYLLVL